MNYQWSKTRYIVTANHRIEKYRAKELSCTVSGDTGTGRWLYYADAEGFGMGHSKLTPADAIRDLFAANGCTDIDWIIDPASTL